MCNGANSYGFCSSSDSRFSRWWQAPPQWHGCVFRTSPSSPPLLPACVALARRACGIKERFGRKQNLKSFKEKKGCCPESSQFVCLVATWDTFIRERSEERRVGKECRSRWARD